MGHAAPRPSKEPHRPPLTPAEYERALVRMGKPRRQAMVLSAGMEVRQLSGGYYPPVDQQQLRVQYPDLDPREVLGQEAYTGLGKRPGRRPRWCVSPVVFPLALAAVWFVALGIGLHPDPAILGVLGTALLVVGAPSRAAPGIRRPPEHDPIARLRARYAAMDDPDWTEFERRVEYLLRVEQLRLRA